jgi:hypothetical protein
MKVEWGVLSDCANIGDGKLNVMGIFQSVMAERVPFAHAKMSIALHIQMEPEEVGIDYQIRPVLVNHKDKVVWAPSEDKAISVRADWEGPERPPEKPNFNLVINLINVRFPAFGKYEIRIEANGEPFCSLPIIALEIP